VAKKVLVTGATGGLGFSLCKKLLRLGWDVYGVGRNSEKLDDLKVMGVKVIKADLLENDSLKTIFSAVPEVDCLINNAGLFPIKNLEESDTSDYDKTFEVNVRKPFQLMSHYIPKMKKRKRGDVINVLSSSAFNGSPDTALYCASKHALLGLTRSAFLENRGTGVNVFSVSPGSMMTEMGATDKRQDFTTFIDPEEVANFICFALASGDSVVYDEVRLNRTVIR